MGTLDGNSATCALVSRTPCTLLRSGESGDSGYIFASSPRRSSHTGGQRNYRCLYVTSISFLRVADPGKPSSVQPSPWELTISIERTTMMQSGRKGVE